MSRYAQFDSTVPPPAPVLGWYDTDLLDYPSLPSPSNLLTLTSDQWHEHFTNPSAWAVSGSALVVYTPTPPTPTLTQMAAALVAGGLTVTSTSTPALNGLYYIGDSQAFGQSDIATEAQFISTYAEFTNGTTSNLAWPLLASGFVQFPTTTSFLNFAKAAGQFIAAVKVAVATNASGLPSAAVTIA